MAGKNVAERISAILKEDGISQKELAKRACLTAGAISHYVKGDREPKGAILQSIANALGTSMDYLRGLTDDMRPADANTEIAYAYQLVARNARRMSLEDKERFVKIMFGGN